MSVRLQLLALALLPNAARGELEAFGVAADWNLLAEAADTLARGSSSGSEACVVEPAEFRDDVDFYVVECKHTAKIVELRLKGDNLYLGRDPLSGGTLTVALGVANSGSLHVVQSCPGHRRPDGDGEWGQCRPYTFDLYRVAGDYGSLSTLAVNGKSPLSSGLMTLSPRFSPVALEYSATLLLGEPFEVMAVAREAQSSVGIAYGSYDSCCVTAGAGRDCEKGSASHEHWRLESPSATGQYVYTVCAIAPDGKSVTSYRLNVQVRKAYSAELASIEIQGLDGAVQLTPTFSPDVRSYVVLLPRASARLSIPLQVTAEDPRAEVAVMSSSGPDGVGTDDPVRSRGSANVSLRMKDNDARILQGLSPEWNLVTVFRVTSADGEASRNYQVTFQQQVSNFSSLQDISVPHCNLSPPFSPEVTEYSCVWKYDSGYDSADIAPVIDEEDCVACEIQMPTPPYPAASRDSDDDLSHDLHLDLESPERIQKWQSNRTWSSRFLYGERHVLPITVVSEDRFTHTTYRVVLERWSPWYMKASFTRAVSSASSTLAGVMAVSSAGNILALAKQVQFMTLTTKIDGVPPTYADFAYNLRHFNLDFGSWLPLDFLPTHAEFIKKKREVVSYIETEVTNAGLLLEYCFAARHHDRLMANAILFYSNRSEGLLRWAAAQNGSEPEPAPRRLESMEWAEDLDLDDDDDEGSLGAWAWRDSDWENLSAHARDDGVTIDQFPALPCNYTMIAETLPLLDFLHEAFVLKDMMESMTGSFLLVVFGGIGLGGLYYAYYRLFMRRSQRRLHFLEPGLVLFFALDFALISFTGGAARLMFAREVVTFFWWRPSFLEVRLFCAAGLLLYPVCFICYATWCVYRATVPREGEEPQLVWNTSFLKNKWSDMRCHDVKVAVRSRLSKAIPLLPRFFVTYVRHCVPVLSDEGEPLVATSRDSGNSLKRRSVLTPEEQLLQQRELADLDRKEEEELASAHSKTVQKFRADRLMKQRARAAREEDRARSHHQMLDSQVERARQDAAAKGADSRAPWLPPGHRAVCNIPLAALTDTWRSRKNREDTDRLDNEEQYAMMQYITQAIEDETRLLKYNILEVAPQQGWLKPKEPVKGDGQRWWLDTREDYDAEDHGMACGHHPDLEEFKKGQDYIEDEFGKRLVYTGHGNSCSWFLLQHFYRWFRTEAAKLEWMEEPDEGWPEWEAQTLKSEANPHSTTRYADKWQWIRLEHWTQPWHLDEDCDTDWHLIRWGSAKYLKFKPARVVGVKLWTQVRKERLRYKRTTVPFQVPAKDKIEIRKWVYGQLMRYMDMKLKLCYLADHHPKFYKTRSLEDMARMRFRDVIFEIETATPNQEKLLEGERHLHRRELMEYTIMRFEDLYDYDTEPWWKGCDQPEGDELKVMFDHATFWRTGDDPEAEELRRRSSIIPANGYSSSEHLTSGEDAEVGVKRYKLWKPDGTSTDVKMSLELKHVLPLMRYTRRFKMNVDSDNLDLPRRTDYWLLLREKGNGEQYNFTVERLCLFLAIMVLSAEAVGETHQGLLAAWVFFFAKFISFVNALVSSIVAQGRERTDEDQHLVSLENTLVRVEPKAAPDDVAATRSGASSRRSARTLLESASCRSSRSARSGKSVGSERDALLQDGHADPEDLEAGEGSSAKKAAHDNGAPEQLETVTILLTVFTEGDVLVLASQCLLLGVIIWTLQFGLPAEIAGFACIVIATVMMLFLGVISSFKEIRDFVEEHAEDLQHLGNKVRAWYYRGGRRAEALRAQLATKVNIIVPDLGITFSGETQDAEEATHEEGLAKLTKKVAYYVHHRAARDGSCPRSVRELPRFKSDIRSSLSIALDMDQMMLRKKIPQIVATLQCVNHVGTSDCCAKNDTYLTLFKPEDWMPEFDTDIQKKEEMLLGWQKQVHRWMKDTLGAVDHARTCARQIQDEIAFNLRKDIMGSKHRTRLKVKVGSIRLPRDGLDGKLAYVTVLDELESIIPTREGGFPTDRTSGFARLQGRPARCCFLPELGAEIDVPVPAYKTKVRLCVWAQVKDGVDELVGFTSEVDLSEHVRAGDDEDLDGDGLGGTGSATLVLHTRWAARGGALVPLCGEEGTAGEAGAAEARQGWSSALAPLSRLAARARRLWQLTEEQKRETLGELSVEVRVPTPEEDEEDVRVMEAVQDLMAGSGALSLAKLEQHRDRWPDLARVFGVRVGEAQCEQLEEHLGRMRAASAEALGSRLGADEREEALLSRGIRAQLADERQMKKATLTLARGIQHVRERLRLEQAAGIVPVPPYELRRRRVAGTKDLELETHGPDRAFANSLLDELWKYRKNQAASRQQILHYVMLSDHLKPNKNWRPDCINAHSAAIVANEFDDVAEVVLSGEGLPGGRARFLQESQSSGVGPLCINGRLCFRAAEPVLPGGGDTFLYWDGRRRWVISPFRGEPVPYGSRASHASKFMWVKDPAVTPDLIQAHWHRWPTDQVQQTPSSEGGPRSRRRGASAAAWAVDHSLRVARAGSTWGGPGYERQQSLKDADCEAGCIGGNVCAAVNEVADLFTQPDRRRVDPELRECLVSLSAKQIVVSWQDIHMERLSPFRRFLLEEFGSYQSAWAFITRKATISRSLAARNLTSMFEAVYSSMGNTEDRDRAFKRLASSLSTLPQVRRGQQTPTQTPRSKRGSLSDLRLLRGRSARSAASMASSEIVLGLSQASSNAVDQQIVGMMEGDQFQSLGHLADTIIGRLDADGTGDITAEELSALYEDDMYDDELLLDFRSWLCSHKTYKKFENMWAELGAGVGVDLAEFTEAIERLTFKLRAYEGMTKDRWTSQDKANSLFKDLDSQMDGRITLNELIPSTGSRPENLQDSMLKFSIPLDIVQDVQAEAHRRLGREQRPCLRINVKPQFELSPEWQALKLALDPDWQPRHNFERLEVCMAPAEFELWRQVIAASSMLRPQEWIRFYEGAYMEHPRISGVYMRHGSGAQRWADGRVYAGQWKNHVYHGQGQTFETTANWKENRDPPSYTGQWELGKRHGEGTLRFEQDLEERSGRAALGRGKQKGIAKVYEGSFRNDLFHGHGVLYMEKAVAQQAPRSSRLSAAPPLPQLQPSQLLHFEGLFLSDYQETFEWVTARDPLFPKAFPQAVDGTAMRSPDGTVLQDLALETLTKRDRDAASDRFLRYFDADAARVQKAGAPMPDLARAAYRMKGGDSAHIKRGQARYADGTEYEGEFSLGRPHGHGRMAQCEVMPDGLPGQQLATYEGGWEAGEFSGHGRYATSRGLVYDGEWAGSARSGEGHQTVPDCLQEAYGYCSYRGQWESNSRDGYGEMAFAQGRYLYKGHFQKGTREGSGKIFRVGPEGSVLLYNGHFSDDVVSATPGAPMWWHILEPGQSRGAFYYGEMTEEGARQGAGTLFGEDADKDAEFLACFEGGQPYTREDPSRAETLQHLIYHGQWRNNLPHGEGTQHFKKGLQSHSVYVGQFANGKRHGRGTWAKKDGSWTYRPLPDKPTFTNWAEDLMHGIGIVEDKKIVHENVIYKRGQCQMPFTQTGPPVTGFEQTAGLGLAVKGARRLVRGGAFRAGPSPAATAVEAKAGRHGLFGKRAGSTLAAMSSSPSLRRGASQNALLAPTRGAVEREEQRAELEDEELALVREPTELSAPEEDVMVSGGTGQNAVVNGHYFKLSGCFGHSIFRLVHRGRLAGDTAERYLYKLGSFWIISAKPFAGPAELQGEPGTAYVEDEAAESPSAIGRPWRVWHPASKSLRPAGEEDLGGGPPSSAPGGGAPGASTAVDRLAVRGVVGFEVGGCAGSVGQGLMLRHGSELYGRPVYESEDGGQFLYWLRDGGSLRDGADDEAYGAGVAQDAEALHKTWFGSGGHWVISTEIGAAPGSTACLAYVEDLATTPDQISGVVLWQARSTQGSREFTPSAGLRLALQEWVHGPGLGP